MIDLTLVELVQIIPAAVGVILCTFSVRRTTQSIQILREANVNGRKLYAGQAARRREASRLGKHALMLGMALWVTEWRITNSIEPTYSFIYATRSLTFSLLSTWMVAETIWEYYDRWVDGRMDDAAEMRRYHSRATDDIAPGA